MLVSFSDTLVHKKLFSSRVYYLLSKNFIVISGCESLSVILLNVALTAQILKPEVSLVQDNTLRA